MAVAPDSFSMKRLKMINLVLPWGVVGFSAANVLPPCSRQVKTCGSESPNGNHIPASNTSQPKLRPKCAAPRLWLAPHSPAGLAGLLARDFGRSPLRPGAIYASIAASWR